MEDVREGAGALFTPPSPSSSSPLFPFFTCSFNAHRLILKPTPQRRRLSAGLQLSEDEFTALILSLRRQNQNQEEVCATWSAKWAWWCERHQM